MKLRVVVRGNGIELRGFMDSNMPVIALRDVVARYGATVLASPAPEDYDPFLANTVLLDDIQAALAKYQTQVSVLTRGGV